MTTKQPTDPELKRLYLHEVFEKYLEKLGLRQTRQRKIILDAVLSSPRHVDAETISKEAKKIDKSIGLATVYRSLKMMTDANILIERHFNEQKACFEFYDEEIHHDHLICNQCGEIIEFFNEEIERKQEEVTKSLGFQLTGHKMELFADCINKANCKRNIHKEQK